MWRRFLTRGCSLPESDGRRHLRPDSLDHSFDLSKLVLGQDTKGVLYTSEATSSHIIMRKSATRSSPSHLESYFVFNLVATAKVPAKQRSKGKRELSLRERQ